VERKRIWKSFDSEDLDIETSVLLGNKHQM
jgi:hypothetical protein